MAVVFVGVLGSDLGVSQGEPHFARQLHRMAFTSVLDLTSVDFVADAHEAAVLRIADLLRHPDDLANKLPLLRKKVAMERASVEAQLKTVMEGQLDGTQRGIDALRNCRAETARVRDALAHMDGLCAEPQNAIKNYTLIKRMSRTHQNFVATKAMVEQFQLINQQLQRIQHLLEEDAVKTIGPAESLLFVHYQLQQLSSFRDATLVKARGCSSDVINTLNSMFKKLEQIEYKFDIYLWNLAKVTVELVKAGYSSAVVRMVKVIEAEERADEMAAIEEEESERAHMRRSRTVKSYRIRFFDVLREAIQEEMRILYDANRNDTAELLRAADGVVDTLIIVNDDVVPLFPKRYNIFHFFVLEYHRAIYEITKKLCEGDLDPATILQLIKWVRDYYANMSARLDVSEDLLEPRLLDGREEELMGEYITLVRSKLTEWLSNILQTETVDFLERRNPPETDGTGQYLLTGSVIIFQMFNQQLDVVATSSRGQLLHDVVMECCNVLDEFQAAWVKILDQEYAKFVAKANDLAEGLVEYTMALANDSLRSSEFSETISRRLEGMTDESVRQAVLARVRSTMDGFMRIAKRGQQILVDIVMSDIQPALNFLHCQQWYEQDIMRLIVGTFEDYGDDFQKHLSEYVYGKVTSELLDRYLVAYIETFKNKNAKYKMPTAVERMHSDLELVLAFFVKTKNAKRAKASFEVIEKIIALLEANPRMVFLDFYALWKAYPDIPLEFIEKLLGKRDDLDKAQLREIMESCRAKAKEERQENVPPTIFSKISMK
ncbi:SNARE-binding exocyst subunit S6 [Polyrhizophydium stewartii]|uniref:SNARE-binding exocyst subunit S6 n=1 Tax=Polyrhizophydium stewartii TaxID=2732419 RepID=A0ABR4NHP2_9FUNG